MYYILYNTSCRIVGISTKLQPHSGEIVNPNAVEQGTKEVHDYLFTFICYLHYAIHKLKQSVSHFSDTSTIPSREENTRR